MKFFSYYLNRDPFPLGRGGCQNQDSKSIARLQVNYHQRTLQLWIQGQDAKEYLTILRDEIKKILDPITGLDVNGYLILPEFARINQKDFRIRSNLNKAEKIIYKSLIEQAKDGIKVIYAESGNKYNLQQVIGFIMTKEEQEKAGITYNINNVGAIGGTGNNHQVHGQVTLSSEAPHLVQPRNPTANNQQYDVFISHASEDKAAVARPLAEALEKQGLKVWYDEFTLRLGDSLRRKIDQGLANSRTGLIILSPDFIKKGWTNYEMDGLVTKSVSGEQILLPIWHNITKQQVVNFSPSLADKVARNTTTHTIDEIALEIVELLK